MNTLKNVLKPRRTQRTQRNIFVISLGVLCVLCGASSADALAAERLPAELTARNVGHYGLCPWGPPGQAIEPGSASDRMQRLDFTIRNVWVRDDEGVETAPEAAARIVQEVNDGLAYDPPKTMIVRIDFWFTDRYEGALQPFEVYQHRMELALKHLEPILDKIHGISISEENIVSEGRPEVLDKMYRFIKGKYPNLRCYQWYTPNTAVPATYEGVFVSADGWIIDSYTLGPDLYPNGPTTRRFVQKYVITGKPVVFIAPGWNFDRFFSPGKPNESFPRGFDGWKNLDDQLQVCLDYNLPVSWYWYYMKNDDVTSGADTALFPLAYETDLGNQMTARINKYIDQAKALPADYDGNAEAADRWDNPPCAVTIQPGRNVLADDFSQSDFLDQSSGSGFRDLVWNGKDLRLRGHRGRAAGATIEYDLKSQAPMQLPQVALSAIVDPDRHGKVVIEMSADDGKTWPVRVESRDNPAGEQKLRADSRPEGWRNGGAFKEVSSLRIRLTLTGDAGATESEPAVTIDDLRVLNRW